MQREAGIEWWLSFHHYYLGHTCFLLGDLKSARSFVEDALKLAQKKNEKHVEGMSLILMGRILGKTDRSQSAKAETYIQQGIKTLEELMLKPLSSPGYLFLGELHTAIGQRQIALENLKKAESMFQEMGMDYWLARTQEVLGRF
jgi:tetratricopeptide (TPR) repeat protein